MAVDVHREIDIAMPGHRLGHLGGNARFGKVRNERVPIGVEIGVQAALVLVLKVIGFFSVLPLLLVFPASSIQTSRARSRSSFIINEVRRSAH
jgi:hypothetical protein